MSEPPALNLEYRVLVLAPTARDAAVSQEMLNAAGVGCTVCKTLAEVCAAIEEGAGVGLLTQESILADQEGCLADTLQRQPPWSDFPLIVLTPTEASTARASRALETVGHMTLLKRPVPIAALVSTIRAALRDRGRQYETRDLFAAVRESSRRLEFALEAGRLGSWELDVRSGVITCSSACKAHFGLPPDAELSASTLFPRLPSEEHQGVLARVSTERRNYERESRTVWPDGSMHWVLIRGQVVDDADGAPRRMVGVSFDITERKQAAEAIRESETKFRLLAESIPQLAWMARADGAIFWYNKRWHDYTGTEPPALEGWDWQSVHDPALLPEVLERWKHSVATGTPFDMVHPLRGAGGRFRSFLTRVMPLRDERGRITLWFGTNTDITERMELEQALQDADRRKDEFLAMLAHELRNPLAAVNNAVTVLKTSDDAENRDWAGDVVERQVKQLTRLIDDLLDVSRITSGKIRLHKEWIDAGPILDQAVESAAPLIRERKHRLHVAIDRGCLPLRVDPTRLEQIVVNLLTNAAKYTETEGQIALTARLDGDHVVIKVRDNGMGIPPEKLPEMFHLFAQGERSIARSEGGLGIGLTIVKRLAEMHDGSVSATSDGPGPRERIHHPTAGGGSAPDRRASDGSGGQSPRGRGSDSRG